MTYIVENNYVLDDYRYLYAVWLNETLYLRSEFAEGYITLVQKDSNEYFSLDDSFEKDEFIRRNQTGADINLDEISTIEELHEQLSGDFFHKFYPDIVNNYAEIREILYYQFGDHEINKALSDLIPSFGDALIAFKKSLSKQPQRTILWKDSRIGFTDSSENIVYLIKHSDIHFGLELVDIWNTLEEDVISQYMYESNIYDELVLNHFDDISNKQEFIAAFISIFQNPSNNAISSNKAALKDITFDYNLLANRINEVGPTLKVNPGELGVLIEEAKKDSKTQLEQLLLEYEDNPQMIELITETHRIIEEFKKQIDE